jgi:flagellar motor switch protein FliM
VSDRPESGANLSQREIDMLRASMSEGGDRQPPADAPTSAAVLPPELARSYDFRYPDKFSRDQLRTVQTIHDTYGRLVMNALAAQARTSVAVQFSSIDQMPFSEYLQSLESPTCIFVAPATPLSGHIVLELSLNIAVHIIDRMQGGSGLRPRMPNLGEVTDIERALMLGIGRWLVGEFGPAWQEITRFNLAQPELHLFPHQVRQILGSEVTLAIVYEIRIFQQIGQLSVAIPGSTLEPVMSRLSASILFAAAGARAGFANPHNTEIDEPVGRVHLPVSVNLGRAVLTMADIVDLRIGDVIVTDQDVHSALEMSVSGETLFEVRPGRIGSRMAAQVINVTGETGNLS